MYLKYFAVLTLLVLFAACGGIKNADEKIAAIDSKLLSLDSAEKLFYSLSMEQLQTITDTVESHLTFVQRNYVGEQTAAMTEPFAQYRTILKLLPDIGTRSKQVAAEIVKTKKQLGDLRAALQSGATVDGVGNKIDNTYVERVYKEEMDVATNLIGEINGIGTKALWLNERYHKHYPFVLNVVDSLRRVIPAIPSLK
jgi:hypothetical protein